MERLPGDVVQLRRTGLDRERNSATFNIKQRDHPPLYIPQARQAQAPQQIGHTQDYLPDGYIPFIEDTTIQLPPPHELAPAPPTPQPPRKLSLEDFQALKGWRGSDVWLPEVGSFRESGRVRGTREDVMSTITEEDTVDRSSLNVLVGIEISSRDSRVR